MNEFKMKVGTFTSPASGTKDLDLGFVPDYFEWWMNEAIADANFASGKWCSGMADGDAYVMQGINAAGAVVTPDFEGTNGITKLDTVVNKPEQWQPATVYAIGDIVKPRLNNGFFYVCTTAGTSEAAAVPPTTAWNTTAGGTTTDPTNTLVWTTHLQSDYPVEKTKVQGVTLGTGCFTASKSYGYIAMRGN